MANNVVTLEPIRSDVLRRAEWIQQRDVLLNEAAQVTEVDSDSALEVSGAVQTRISKHIKKLDKARKDVTGPIDKLKKAIMAEERDLKDHLEKELDRLKSLNSKYATRIAEEAARKRREAEEAEANAAVEQQKKAESLFGAGVTISPDPVIPSVPIPEPPKTTANRMVERWSFRVVDPKLVPVAFCTPDPVKIRSFMNYQVKLGKTPEIPGVVFDKTVSVESR